MMSGGTVGHGDIAENILMSLNQRLAGTGCRARGGNVRVRNPAGKHMYPDVFVSCGRPHRSDVFIDDPVLVVEVLSLSTEGYDQTIKRWAYQEIETLRTLVLVSQDEMKLELVTRAAGGTWSSTFLVGPRAVLPLSDLDVELPLAEIYADIDFEET